MVIYEGKASTTQEVRLFISNSYFSAKVMLRLVFLGDGLDRIVVILADIFGL